MIPCFNIHRFYGFTLSILSCSSLILSSHTIAAPSLSDINAQELIRQQEREKQQQERLQTNPEVRLENPSDDIDHALLPKEETPCFEIKKIVLIGEASDKFQWALKAANPTKDPALNQCLGSQGINLVMRRIQNAVIAKGYVTTRILAGEQDLTSGVLTLTVVPGKVRNISLTEQSNTHIYLPSTIPMRSGDILNLRKIEQGLENLKRTPTSDADIQIEPTDEAGQSDLAVQWTHQFPLRMNISLDDSGSKATGRYQGSATLSIDNPLMLNDLFYVSAGHDVLNKGHKGTKSYSAYYGLPIGNWFVSGSISKSEYYQNVAGLNQNYEYSGENHNSDIRLSRLIYRDATKKLTLNGRLWAQDSKNFVEDTEVEVQRRKTAGWEAGVNYRQYMGNASIDLNLTYRRGTGANNALPAPEEHFNEGTSRMKIIFVDAQYNQPFKIKDLNFRFSSVYRGQWNRTPLTPQDKFSIGGRYTVRGFDGEYSLSSERGWLLRNDLALAIPPVNAELYVGLDYGKLGGPSKEYLIGDHLTGSALGVRGSISRYFSYDLFIGWALDKPKGLHTKGTTAGFNAYLSF